MAAAAAAADTRPSMDLFELLAEEKERDIFFDLIADKQKRRMSMQRSPGPAIGGFIYPDPAQEAQSPPPLSPPLSPQPGQDKASKKKGKKAKKAKSKSKRGKKRAASETADVAVVVEGASGGELSSFKWFQERVNNRADAEFMLAFYQEGTFMVRRSGDSHVFSVKWNKSPGAGFCTHVKITKTAGGGVQMCAMDDFASVAELVEFYAAYPETFARRFWAEAEHPPPALSAFDIELHGAEILAEKQAQNADGAALLEAPPSPAVRSDSPGSGARTPSPSPPPVPTSARPIGLVQPTPQQPGLYSYSEDAAAPPLPASLRPNQRKGGVPPPLDLSAIGTPQALPPSPSPSPSPGPTANFYDGTPRSARPPTAAMNMLDTLGQVALAVPAATDNPVLPPRPSRRHASQDSAPSSPTPTQTAPVVQEETYEAPAVAETYEEPHAALQALRQQNASGPHYDLATP